MSPIVRLKERPEQTLNVKEGSALLNDPKYELAPDEKQQEFLAGQAERQAQINKFGAPEETSPVVSSSTAENNLTAQMSQFELPGAETEQDRQKLFEDAQKQREDRFQSQRKEIEAVGRRRRAGAEQEGKAVFGEARAALASLGLLPEEPMLTKSSDEVQFMVDIKQENKQQIDLINEQEQQLIASARDAANADDLNLQQQFLEQIDELRQERNLIRSQQFAEITEMIRLQRAGDSAAIEQKMEERAAKQFERTDAINTFALMDQAGAFENLDQFSPAELGALERKMGVLKGTFESYATAKAKLAAVEGWTGNIFTDQNTGQVTGLFTRMGDDGQPEYFVQDYGAIGDRFKAAGAPGVVPTTPTEEAQTFEEFIAEKEQILQQTLDPNQYESFRAEFEEAQILQTSILNISQGQVISGKAEGFQWLGQLAQESPESTYEELYVAARTLAPDLSIDDINIFLKTVGKTPSKSGSATTGGEVSDEEFLNLLNQEGEK